MKNESKTGSKESKATDRALSKLEATFFTKKIQKTLERFQSDQMNLKFVFIDFMFLSSEYYSLSNYSKEVFNHNI